MQLHRPVPLGTAGVVAVECGGLRLSVRRRDGDAAAVGQQHHTETQTQQQAQQQVVVPVRHLGDTPARHVTSETPAVSRHNVIRLFAAAESQFCGLDKCSVKRSSALYKRS